MTQIMKAMVSHRYGSPDCEEVEKPTAGNDEVLIRVHAASVLRNKEHTVAAP
jgi:NADPH:quinone reductase-like Zn-dependent oxidoreductase